MSNERRATVSAWSRHEDGSYAAELGGLALRVRYVPAKGEQAAGFTWEALKGDDEAGKRVAPALYEEIEYAMGAAEALADGP